MNNNNNKNTKAFLMIGLFALATSIGIAGGIVIGYNSRTTEVEELKTRLKEDDDQIKWDNFHLKNELDNYKQLLGRNDTAK